MDRIIFALFISTLCNVALAEPYLGYGAAIGGMSGPGLDGGRGLGMGLTVGYQFNPNLADEGSTMLHTLYGTGNVGLNTLVTSANVLVMSSPRKAGNSAFLRVGMASTLPSTSNGTTNTPATGVTGAVYSAGLQFTSAVDPNSKVRIEFERAPAGDYGTGTTYIDSLQVNLLQHFK